LAEGFADLLDLIAFSLAVTARLDVDRRRN